MKITRAPKLKHLRPEAGPVPAEPAAPAQVAAEVLPRAITPAPRLSFVWNGVTIFQRFAQRPRVQHLEVSRPRGAVSGRT